mmetsp:Transcript_30071/g.26650  ORF Transcript_30071/g.26650 Transcript_30071/m.26650 type:complete len:98 (+) Transcript_30071:138-431(+)
MTTPNKVIFQNPTLKEPEEVKDSRAVLSQYVEGKYIAQKPRLFVRETTRQLLSSLFLLLPVSELEYWGIWWDSQWSEQGFDDLTFPQYFQEGIYNGE